MLFSSYPLVRVESAESLLDRERLTESLTTLARETKSTVAKRIVQPQKDGETRFFYEIYGKGTFLKASKKDHLKPSQPAM